MTENMKQFTELISNDDSLQEELRAALQGVEAEEQTQAVIQFAVKKGYTLSKKDFVLDDGDFSLDELDSVAGAGGCGCAVGGGGAGDDLSCMCCIIGNGFVKNKRKCQSPSQGCCACPLAGAGATRRH